MATIRSTFASGRATDRAVFMPCTRELRFTRRAVSLSVSLALALVPGPVASATQPHVADTSHVLPVRPARRELSSPSDRLGIDYDATISPGALSDTSGHCIPTAVEGAACMAFDRYKLHGLGPRPTTDSTTFHAYCYPAQGHAADSLDVYIWPCTDPSAIQVRLHDGVGALIEVLPLVKICPETCEAMRHHITTPRRRYTLEIVGYGTRLVRPIILGAIAGPTDPSGRAPAALLRQCRPAPGQASSFCVRPKSAKRPGPVSSRTKATTASSRGYS